MPQANQLTRFDANDLRAIESTGRMDAGEAIYFARQLEYIRPLAYEVRRVPLSALRLIPVSTDVPPGAKTITYRMFDTVGMAKIISNYADDLPRVGVSGKEFTTPIRGIGISYGYSMQDIRAAAMTGANLDTSLQSAAKRGHDETINKLAWNGDAISGLPGLLSNPNLPLMVIPSDGTGGLKTFVSKTSDQIVRDMNNLVASVLVSTSGIHTATQIWMPITQYSYINTTVRSQTSDKTILQMFQSANPGVTVMPVVEMKGAGPGGTDMMIALENNRDNFRLEIPMSFYQHSPQLHNLEYTIPCESRIGGVVVVFPLAFAIGTGI